MAFEREAITSTPATNNNQSPMMKEERIVEAYKPDAKRLAQATESLSAKNGQIDTNGGAGAATPGTEDTVTLTPQLAAVLRQQQKARKKEQEIKAKEQALAEREAKLAKYAEMDSKLAQKDYSAVDGLIDYDAYTNHVLNKNSSMTPEQQKIAELENKLNGIESAQKNDVTKRFEAAVNDRRNAVKTLVESNSEFKRIKALEAQEAVVHHILDTWEKDEIDLTPEQAAKEVEEILKEREQKWLSISREETTQGEVEGAKKPLPQLKSGIKTLTNNMAATGESKTPLKPLSLMSETERYAEARRRAEEKLKLQSRR